MNTLIISGNFFFKKEPQIVTELKDMKKGGWVDLIVTLRLGYDGPSNCASTIKINNAEDGLRVLFATLCA